MRRWNGWGDDTVKYPLTQSAMNYLQENLGEGIKYEDVQISEAIKKIPNTRLKSHPMVSTDPEIRIRHARGQSFPDWVAMRSGRIGEVPDGVAFPTSDDDVIDLLRFAKHSRVKLIPYGGGTSVVGHINIIPTGHPVLTMDLGRMNRLHKIDEESGLATFGAGVSGSDLEAQLRARGYTMGHFPQSFEYSTLGGWIATRSSGQQSMGYGRIESLFVGGAVETPLGRIDLPVFPASAAGPDLKSMVLGSEGRLGIITNATVRITPLPEREDFHALFFPNWDNGFDAVKNIIQSKSPISMLRYSTASETQSTLAIAGHENLINILETLLSVRGAKEEKCMLLVGFTGSDELVKNTRKMILGLAGNHGGIHVGRTFGNQWQKTRFRTPYLRNTLWELGYGIDTLETAVPWSKVNQTISEIERAIKDAANGFGEPIHIFSHLSHIYPTGSSIYTTYLFRLDQDLERTLHKWKLMKGNASKVIIENNGTISHQHGVGMDHAPYLSAEKGEIGIAAIQNICRFFDPKGIMNPGKLLGIR